MADEKNLDLYVASYPDESSATADFTALKKARDVDELTVIAAVVASRNAEGTVEVKEHDAGAAHRALGWGAVGGLVVGLFSPALLASTAIGAAVGGVVHELRKHHEEHELGIDAEQYLAPGTSAIIALLDDTYADRLDKVLAHADKKVAKAIDSGNVDKLAKALTDAGYDVQKALDS